MMVITRTSSPIIAEDTDTKCLNLIQHVQNCTHRQGHIPDLVITCEADDLVWVVSILSMTSEHFVNAEVSLEGPFVLATSV